LTNFERLPDRHNTLVPDAVVFDLDGLMIDTERLDWQAAKAVGAAYHIDLDDDFLRRTIGRRLVDVQPEFERRFAHAVGWDDFAREIRAWREEAVARVGALFGRMHAAAIGDDVAEGKPAPDIYLLAVKRLGVPADRCLALEDSLPGVESAERAGLTVIMVPDLVPPHGGIRYVCPSLLGVRDWLAA